MTILICLLLLGLPAFAQVEGAPVSLNPVPFYRGLVSFQYFDGSNRIEYTCQAYSGASRIRLTVSGATAASPGVFTTADHGWYRNASAFDRGGYTPLVRISGGTGNWAAANGDWVAVGQSSTTFTLVNRTTGTALNTTGFGAVTGTLVAESQSPRLNDYHWFIRKFLYDGSGNNTAVLNGYGLNGLGRARCDQRATDGLVEYR